MMEPIEIPFVLLRTASTVVPLVLGIAGLVLIVLRVLDANADVRRADVKARRDQDAQIQRRSALIASEIALRADFGAWIDDAVLRVEIERAAHPKKGRADVLNELESARAVNTKRIIALREQGPERPVPGDPDAARQNWSALRQLTLDLT